MEAQVSPLAAERLFGVPASELADRVIDLGELWGDRATELVERVGAAPTIAERFEMLDATLATHADRTPPVDPILEGAWAQVIDSQGSLTMGALRDQTGWSRRRLARAFREHAGLPPKTLARLVRFQHAVRLLRRPGHRSLASVADICGYCDQAHFNREFRELAGQTPTSFLAELRADTAGADMGVDPTQMLADTNVQDRTERSLLP